MTPREHAIERLRIDAKAAGMSLEIRLMIWVLSFVALGALGCALFIASSEYKQTIHYVALFFFIFVFIAGIAGIRPVIQYGKTLTEGYLVPLDTLAECEPFYTAYRNGQMVTDEKSLQSEAKRRELREKYHRLKGSIENQLPGYTYRKNISIFEKRDEDAQGVTALILDLEDAEKQLQKELSFIEREYQPIQPAQVRADPPPVARTKPTRETGLEGY